MPNELNPMQTPPEVEYAREFLNKTLTEKIQKKFEIFSKMDAADKTDFLEFDFKFGGILKPLAELSKMPPNEFKNAILQSALAANAYHTERLGGHSAVIDQTLKDGKEKLEKCDFSEAFNAVAAILQTRIEYFCFYILYSLESVKKEFSEKQKWRNRFEKIEKYKQFFQNDLKTLELIFDFVERQK